MGFDGSSSGSGSSPAAFRAMFSTLSHNIETQTLNILSKSKTTNAQDQVKIVASNELNKTTQRLNITNTLSAA